MIQRYARAFILQQLERSVRQLLEEQKVIVVAITGSMGKTTTKHAIARVLEQKYRVLAHEGNYNSEFGLPLSIFEESVPVQITDVWAWVQVLSSIRRKLKKRYPYEVVVVEMGADHPGDIGKFLSYIHPDIGVVTAIAPAHIGQFGSIEAIAAEKMLVASGARQAVINADDDRVYAAASALPQPAIGYGIKRGNTRLLAIKRAKDATLSCNVRLDGVVTSLHTSLIARHGLYAVAAACAVAQLLGVSGEQIARGVSAIKPTPGRMNPLSGSKGSRLIDDSYNANPDAVLAAVGALLELPGKRIAILGSMNELGDDSKKEHERVGRACVGLDLLVTIGDDAKAYLAPAARKAGLAKTKIHSFASPYEAGEFVKEHLNDKTTVLIKGSQNRVFSEEATALLLDNIADCGNLVRQSVDWLAKKQAQFGRSN